METTEKKTAFTAWFDLDQQYIRVLCHLFPAEMVGTSVTAEIWHSPHSGYDVIPVGSCPPVLSEFVTTRTVPVRSREYNLKGEEIIELD